MSAVPMAPCIFFQLCCLRLAYPGFSNQRDNWHNGQDTQQVGEPEAPMDGGSQWPWHSMWYLMAMVLSVWALVEDREEAGRSLDSLEKVLQTASSHLPDKVARSASGTMGWIFLTALKANMDSACRQAVQVSKLQR